MKQIFSILVEVALTLIHSVAVILSCFVVYMYFGNLGIHILNAIIALCTIVFLSSGIAVKIFKRIPNLLQNFNQGKKL